MIRAMAVSLEVQDLRKQYGGGPLVLDGISFRYDGAGAIGYLGPNGAGKTTTLKILTGLLAPTSGEARLNGFDVRTDRKRALWDVGAVIETPEPYPSQTVRETMEMVGAFRGVPPAELATEIPRLAQELNLPPLETRTGRISKGQRQRVVIAATLLGDPTLLILDEPTSGLDPAERILIREILVRLKADHLILMSSHLMSEVTEICDQVIFLNRGKVALADRVDVVAERFRSRLVEVEFLQPIQPQQIAALGRPLRSVVALTPQRFRIAFDGGDPERAAILVRLQTLAPVVSYAPSGLALEDAYLQLIQ